MKTRYSRLVTLLALLLAIVDLGVAKDKFTSLDELAELTLKQDDFMEAIEDYIAREEKRITQLEKSLHELKALQAAGTEPRADHGNPIDAYGLLRRWDDELGFTPTGSNLALDEMLTKVGVTLDFLPTSSDRQGALEGLGRLQATYDLSTSDLIQGRLLNSSADPMVKDAEDFMNLGVSAMSSLRRHHAREWLTLALKAARPGSPAMHATLWHLAVLHSQVNDFGTAVLYGEKTLRELSDKTSDRWRDYSEQVETWRGQQDEWQDAGSDAGRLLDERPLMGDYAYLSLCRGAAPPKDAALSCHWRHGVAPYIRYGEELLSLAPRVSLIYNVSTDREAMQLKELSRPRLHRARVADMADPTKSERGVVSNKRTGKVSWLEDYGSSTTWSLSERLGAITGLSIASWSEIPHSEPWQVQNYGFAGHYSPHFDSIIENMAEGTGVPLVTQDRIATALIYLNDVEGGGATVFPKIGLSIKPVKNAAAFWYNLLPNGSRDDRTEHAGCPVLLGDKWVANKWIHQGAQSRQRPCILSEDDSNFVDEPRGLPQHY